jgi:hypothetical protein
MSGPTKRYDGGNVNFLVTEEHLVALDLMAERENVYRSDIMRDMVEAWFVQNGLDHDEEVKQRVMERIAARRGF